MTALEDLRAQYAAFVEERDWAKYHTPKNIAEAISIESAELLELFLWHDNLDATKIEDDERLVSHIEEELADVVIYCLGMANRLDIDLAEAVQAKLEANENRFDEDETRQINRRLDRYRDVD
jgi:NTP pyrophosphatase (non-canonical NTP hydrolase)